MNDEMNTGGVNGGEQPSQTQPPSAGQRLDQLIDGAQRLYTTSGAQPLGTKVGQRVNTGLQGARTFYKGQTKGGKFLVWFSVAVTVLLLISLIRRSATSQNTVASSSIAPTPITDPAAAPHLDSSATAGLAPLSPEAAAVVAKYANLDQSLLMYEIDKQVRPVMDDVQKELWGTCKNQTVMNRDDLARQCFDQMTHRQFQFREVPTEDQFLNVQALLVLFNRSIGADVHTAVIEYPKELRDKK